jgi:hypothetical protein
VNTPRHSTHSLRSAGTAVQRADCVTQLQCVPRKEARTAAAFVGCQQHLKVSVPACCIQGALCCAGTAALQTRPSIISFTRDLDASAALYSVVRRLQALAARNRFELMKLRSLAAWRLCTAHNKFVGLSFDNLKLKYIGFSCCRRLCFKMEAKACKTAMADPLQQLGVLQLVMHFVGHKEYLYMSLVNSTWSAEYQVMALTMPCEHSFHAGRCTSYAAVFSSVSRLRLAVCDSAGLYLRHRFHLRGDGKVERAAGSMQAFRRSKRL